jgi:type I restriction enzyme S subunit
MKEKGFSQLPTRWGSASLEHICEVKVRQGSPDTKPVPYIDIGSIDRQNKKIGELVSVTSENAPSRAKQWVKPGDVLVSMTRPNLNAVALIPDSLNGAIASTGFDVLRPFGVLPEWIFARVQSREFVLDICKGLQGVVYPAVRPQDIRRHLVPIPPFSEQKRIIAAIDDHFSRLDEAVMLLERVQRNLKRYRASVLKAAVEGRLVPTEAELARAEGRDYEPASVLLDKITNERHSGWAKSGKGKYKDPIKPDISSMPLLPEGWCWTTLDALIIDGPQNGIYVPKSQYKLGTPILRIDDFQIDWSRSSKELQQIHISEEEINSYGLQSLVITNRHIPAVFESNMMRMRFSDLLQVAFVHFYISSLDGKKRLTQNAKWAVNQASINQLDVVQTVVPLPPATEQRRIVAVINEKMTAIAQTFHDVALSNDRCRKLRQSILKHAFEGKLVEQDPSNEPASVLLERIKAERAGT